MITKIQYTDQANRQVVLDANKAKILIEEQNINRVSDSLFSLPYLNKQQTAYVQ